MKNLNALALTLLSTILLSVSPHTFAAVKVYILAGQSNMVGDAMGRGMLQLQEK